MGVDPEISIRQAHDSKQDRQVHDWKQDGQGNPQISCYDHTNDDLKHAYIPGLPSMVLECDIAADLLVLAWNPVPDAIEYWVYGASNRPWYSPGFGSGYQYRISIVEPTVATWSTGNGIGDPSASWTYLVMAVDEVEVELAISNRVGEHDFRVDSQRSARTADLGITAPWLKTLHVSAAGHLI